MSNKNLQKVYAFIDSQNLNLGIRGQGWKLDHRRFRVYLHDKYNVSKAFIFIGYLSVNKKLYSYLRKAGYELVYKKVLVIKRKNLIKGNVDAELVLNCAKKQFDNYDKAVVVSGDGDFYCLYEFLQEENKLLKILLPNSQKFSSLLKDYNDYLVPMNNLKQKLSRQKNGSNICSTKSASVPPS